VVDWITIVLKARWRIVRNCLENSETGKQVQAEVLSGAQESLSGAQEELELLPAAPGAGCIARGVRPRRFVAPSPYWRGTRGRDPRSRA
jgi:hypothetical protein